MPETPSTLDCFVLIFRCPVLVVCISAALLSAASSVSKDNSDTSSGYKTSSTALVPVEQTGTNATLLPHCSSREEDMVFGLARWEGGEFSFELGNVDKVVTCVEGEDGGEHVWRSEGREAM